MISKTLAAAAFGKEAKIYAYHGAGNYCPAGLQPVTINGAICCGTPNAGSYQQAMMHPTPRKKHVHVKKHTHKKYHTHAKRHAHNTMHRGQPCHPNTKKPPQRAAFPIL